MTDSNIYSDYKSQLGKLKEVVKKTNANSVAESPDPYFEENINFFTKSFLVTICAYLESFIKDITFSCIENINARIKSTEIPHNLILWDLNYDKEIKDKSYSFKNLRVRIKKKDLDDHISGSPFRTIKLFRNIGVDLESNDDFNTVKEKINMIVVKRNKILHHNDDASDISFSDVLQYIKDIDKYMKILDDCIEEIKK
ncbi:hypothetical protein HPE56_11775 [Maribacter sp. ANRC-HE7]|uniref:RiboL-PSP-HEPN domain-containing protein n=1 Tax=Maribacter aquimaris TaxID=2737171 RepID=A0ABR7V3G1_9FLAO|nr:HEPN domain-containing protein [Maribacter aquimaris]MBD0778475.1 hypothetical protein [Maribacter aquimaris]